MRVQRERRRAHGIIRRLAAACLLLATAALVAGGCGDEEPVGCIDLGKGCGALCRPASCAEDDCSLYVCNQSAECVNRNQVVCDASNVATCGREGAKPCDFCDNGHFCSGDDLNRCPLELCNEELRCVPATRSLCTLDDEA